MAHSERRVQARVNWRLTSKFSSSLLNDDYKSKPVVEIYDWRKEPFLDHYRLRVPMIRTRLEFASFAIILVLFVLTELSEPFSSLVPFPRLTGALCSSGQ